MAIHPLTRHITRHPDILAGEPIISGTRTSVRAIVELWRLGTPPEEIVVTHLPHLTLAQVFDALGFDLDNSQEINTYIQRNRVSDAQVHPVVKAALEG